MPYDVTIITVKPNRHMDALKGIEPDALAAATTDNFFRLFRKATRPASIQSGAA